MPCALLLDQPAGETAHDGFDTSTIANAVAIRLELGEIGCNGSMGELLRLKGPSIPWPLGDPSRHLPEDARVDIDRGRSLALQGTDILLDERGYLCCLDVVHRLFFTENYLVRVLPAQKRVIAHRCRPGERI